MWQKAIICYVESAAYDRLLPARYVVRAIHKAFVMLNVAAARPLFRGRHYSCRKYHIRNIASPLDSCVF